jgi:glycosyltransferase involved in cell wall biosynthesis
LNSKVSVVIPLFNKEDYIEQTLRSVMNQSYKNIECLIVDDGSTDNSVNIVRRFIEENQLPWKLLSQSNSGQTKARNNGIRKSVGEYVAFLDSDDLWPPDKIELQVKAIEIDPNVVLVLSAYAIFNDTSSVPRIVRHKRVSKMNARWLDMRGFGGGLESLGLMKRTTLDQIGLFDENLSTSSGLDLSLRLERVGKIVLLKQLGLYYRISAGQWHGNSVALKRDLLTLKEKHTDSSTTWVARLQDAYFFWTAVRLEGLLAFTKALAKSLLKLDLINLSMCKSLIFRNYHSRLLGWLERKKTRRFLTVMDTRR